MKYVISALSETQLIIAIAACAVALAIIIVVIAVALVRHGRNKKSEERPGEAAESSGEETTPLPSVPETQDPPEEEREEYIYDGKPVAEERAEEPTAEEAPAEEEPAEPQPAPAAPVPEEETDRPAEPSPEEAPAEEQTPAEDNMSEPQQESADTEESAPAEGADVTGELSDLIVTSETDEAGTVTTGGRRIYVMYNRSFTAKLIQADETVQAKYGRLKNELLSYKKVRSRMSWTNDSFRLGRETVAKFALRGKTLSLYLALDPASLEGTKYRYEDASSVARYAAVPVRLKLKSDRSVKYAAELIARLAEEKGAPRADIPAVDYTMPYESTEALIKRGLIKLLATDEVGTEVVKADFGAISREKFKRVTGLEVRESVSVAEAAGTITDETAAQLTIREEKKSVHRGTKKGIINIDTLSANFASGDVVDLIALKEKGLVARNVGHVKVLARGVLDKSLTVMAQDFSLDAVKMIALTGGAAVID